MIELEKAIAWWTKALVNEKEPSAPLYKALIREFEKTMKDESRHNTLQGH